MHHGMSLVYSKSVEWSGVRYFDPIQGRIPNSGISGKKCKFFCLGEKLAPSDQWIT